MASPYDYYLNQQTPQMGIPGIRSAGPNRGAESSSVWGQMRRPLAGGAGLGTALAGLGVLGAGPAAMGGLAAGQGILSGLGSDESIMSTGGLRTVLNPLNYRNFNLRSAATFGSGDRSRAAQEAAQQNANAIANWRAQTQEDLNNYLRSQGPSAYRLMQQPASQVWQAGAGSTNPEDVQRAAQAQMTAFEQAMQQYLTGRKRAYEAGRVNQWMMDPNRIAQQRQDVEAQRQASMADLADQTRQQFTTSAQNLGRKGMLGSSVDASAQGEIAAERDRGAASIQQQAEQRANAYRMGDQTTRDTLMGLIYGGADNAGLAQTLASLQGQSQGLGQMSQIGSQRQQASNAAAQGYGQAIGGLLSAGSKPLGYYIEHQGTGA